LRLHDPARLGIARRPADRVRQASRIHTGGPAVRNSLPRSGQQWIDEHQVFILGLDAPAKADSVRRHAYCAAQGIAERIPVRLLEGEERRQVLENRESFLTSWYQAILKRGGRALSSYPLCSAWRTRAATRPGSSNCATARSRR